MRSLHVFREVFFVQNFCSGSGPPQSRPRTMAGACVGADGDSPPRARHLSGGPRGRARKAKVAAGNLKEKALKVGLCGLHGRQCTLSHPLYNVGLCKEGNGIVRGHFRQVKKVSKGKWKADKHAFIHRNAQWRADNLHLVKEKKHMERHRRSHGCCLHISLLASVQFLAVNFEHAQVCNTPQAGQPYIAISARSS